MEKIRIDYRQLLDEYGIEYRARGKNVWRNHLAVSCYACEDGDPSYHLNIKLDGTSCKCFRCGHYSNNIFDITKNVFPDFEGVSYKELIAEFKKYPLLFDELQESIIEPNERKFNKLLNSFPLLDNPESKKQKRYFTYLTERQYTINNIIKKQFRYCSEGKYEGRIIVPIKDEYGTIVNFLGRHISQYNSLRYFNCKKDDAILPISHCLYNLFECLQIIDLKYIVLTEGVFDADTLLSNDIPAIAIFKMILTEEQVNLLMEYLNKDIFIFVMLDSTVSKKDKNKIVDRLGIHFQNIHAIMFSGVKDANLMNNDQIARFKSKISQFIQSKNSL